MESFARPLQVEPGHSRGLLGYFIFVHLSSVLIILTCLPLPAGLALACLVLAALKRNIELHALRLAPDSLKRVECSVEGCWSVTSRQGGRTQTTTPPEVLYAGAALLVVRLSPRRRYDLLPRDAFGPDQFRAVKACLNDL